MGKHKVIFFLLYLLAANSSFAQDEIELCMGCHSDVSLTKEIDNKTISLFVNQNNFINSVHADIECTSCHGDIDVDDLPHDEDFEKVDCSMCHDDAVEHYERSLHGVAFQEGKYLAPTCITCHGKHNILSSKNEKSKTYVMNIPSLCGDCHKEDTPISKLRGISQRHILQDYAQSIHGDGLFRRGLTVTAVCTSCHSSHDILPHENSLSTINRNNIAQTCMQCHSQIEKVHQKVIRGELWEKEPDKIPICIDCHQPHKVRRVFYEESYPDESCMSCHSKKDIYKTVNGERRSLHVDIDEFRQSVHGTNTCIKCHTNVSQAQNPVCKTSGKVDCSICHPSQQEDYDLSHHGTLVAAGNKDAPYCTDCHDDHGMKSNSDLSSPTFARNIPALCGKCHKETKTDDDEGIHGSGNLVNYSMSIHGKGLLESGLLVTATCVDCHTTHRELPASDPRSSVNHLNIATTCANCHLGIYEEFKKSIHSPLVTETNKELPACNDCHFSHTIERVDRDDFRHEILTQCGRCHMDVTETYFDTFHGKVSKLGSTNAAKCHDCHGAHNILPTYNPESTLSRGNVIETCKQCHPNSNRKFVGYLTHATHHDKDKYPYLYYTFWFMTFLLIGTFTFFGIHTLLWLPRALAEKKKQRIEKEKTGDHQIEEKDKDDES